MELHFDRWLDSLERHCGPAVAWAAAVTGVIVVLPPAVLWQMVSNPIPPAADECTGVHPIRVPPPRHASQPSRGFSVCPCPRAP
jgi:hypothetical protein